MDVFTKDLHPLYGELLLHVAQSHGLVSENLRSPLDFSPGLKSIKGDSWFVDLLYKMLESHQYQARSVGFDYGRRLDLAAAGIIGQAVMTAGTLGESLELMCRYYSLTGLELYFSQEIRGDEFLLYPVLNYDDLDPRIEIFIIESFMSSWKTCSQLLVQHPPMPKRIHLRYSPPSYSEKYLKIFPCEVLFNCPRTLFSLDASALQLPTVTSNSFVHQRAVAHCEAGLSKLGGGKSLHEKVRKHLRVASDLNLVNIDTVAQSMHLSTRTLNRRLQSEGYRFQTLFDQERCATACRLLDRSDWSLEKIAECIGYSDASNFRRAFRKWTEMTPSEYRNKV